VKIKNAPNLKKVWAAYRSGKTGSLNAVEKKTLKGIKARMAGKSKKVSPATPSKKESGLYDAFPRKKEASALVQDLRAEGHAAWVKKIAPQGGDGGRLKFGVFVKNPVNWRAIDRASWSAKARPPRKNRVTFARGKVARAKRDVLARRLRKHRHIKSPYGLATSMVKRGAHVRDHAIGREFAEQKRMRRKNPTFAEVVATKISPVTQKGPAIWEMKGNNIPVIVTEIDEINHLANVMFKSGATYWVNMNNLFTLKKNPYDVYGRRFEDYFTDRSGIVRPLASKEIRRREHWKRGAIPLRKYVRANVKKKRKASKKILIRIGRRLFKGTRAEANKLIKAGYRPLKKNPRFVGGKGSMTAIEYKGTDGAHYRHDFKQPRHFEVVGSELVAAPVAHSKTQGLTG